MDLDHFVEKSFDAIKENKKGLLFLTAATLFDGATTIYLVNHNEEGINGELWLPMRYYMNNFGVEEGVVLAKACSYVSALYLSKLMKDKTKFALFCLGIPGMLGGIFNFSQIVATYYGK